MDKSCFGVTMVVAEVVVREKVETLGERKRQVWRSVLELCRTEILGGERAGNRLKMRKLRERERERQ